MSNISYTRRFRSRLNQLPLDLKCEIGEVPLQKGMRPTSRKDKVKELFEQYKVPVVEIGTGTNRFIVKYDGYALKIALDNEGIADNKQEFAICESLMPHVAYAHEISTGGHLLVAQYCPAFTTSSEMRSYPEIPKILEGWARRFLLGDVGLSAHNYANWGLAPGGRPVCIDYAYIFPASFDLFKCDCGCKQMTFAHNDYTTYKCTACGREYEDRELRMRISQDERLRLFNNVNGITMRDAFEEHEVSPEYIEFDESPDSPDIYEAAVAVSDMMRGKETNSFYKGGY